jgi:hypothetical protein
MLHGFFFVAVFSVTSRFYQLCHCVSNCFYEFTPRLIRQADNTVYYYLYVKQKPLTGFSYYAEIRSSQPSYKPCNPQVL